MPPPGEHPLIDPLASPKHDEEHQLPIPSNIHILNNPPSNCSLEVIPSSQDANIQTIPSLTFQRVTTYHHHLLLQDYLAAKTIPQGFQLILDRMIDNICPPFPFPQLNRLCQNYPTKSPSMQPLPLYPNTENTPTNMP